MTASIVMEITPSKGPNRNMKLELPAGMIVSFISSLRKSAYGWNHGGPTRQCIRAVTFLSTQVMNKPTTAVKRNPGNTMKLKSNFTMFMMISCKMSA
jgi:hypothetical protein